MKQVKLTNNYETRQHSTDASQMTSKSLLERSKENLRTRSVSHHSAASVKQDLEQAASMYKLLAEGVWCFRLMNFVGMALP
jgi:hypothetical protein